MLLKTLITVHSNHQKGYRISCELSRESDEIFGEDGNDSSDYAAFEDSSEDNDDEIVSKPEDEIIHKPEGNHDASHATTSNTNHNLWTENQRNPELFIFQENIDLHKCKRWFSKFRASNFDLSDSYRTVKPTTLDNDVLRAKVEANSLFTKQKSIPKAKAMKKKKKSKIHSSGNLEANTNNSKVMHCFQNTRPVPNKLVKNFNRIPMAEHLCVDEQIISFKGRNRPKEIYTSKHQTPDHQLPNIRSSDNVTLNQKLYTTTCFINFVSKIGFQTFPQKS
ncbi:piggyBac transposable element-derived protein 3-like [Vespula maculifrons]|uniref:PiggyBac transposable element-derived protein 3-like n=1 Tax=Vespula maculifrons TaxID=7453 RepID=A0ABD2AQM6_VESMC